MGWKAIGTRDTWLAIQVLFKSISLVCPTTGTNVLWLAIQAERSIVSHEEGLIAFRGKTYQLQDPGDKMVTLVVHLCPVGISGRWLGNLTIYACMSVCGCVYVGCRCVYVGM